MVGAVTAFLRIPKSAAVVLVDVMSCVVLPSIVDEALLDGYCFPSSREWFLMHRRLPLIPSWLDALLYGCSSMSRG